MTRTSESYQEYFVVLSLVFLGEHTYNAYIYCRMRRVAEPGQRGKKYSGMLADPVGQETRIPRASVISTRPLRLSAASDLDIHHSAAGPGSRYFVPLKQ